MSDLPPIEFAFPELRRWEKGAAPYIHVLESGKPGPVVMVAALTHGNEPCGTGVAMWMIERWMIERRLAPGGSVSCARNARRVSSS